MENYLRIYSKFFSSTTISDERESLWIHPSLSTPCLAFPPLLQENDSWKSLGWSPLDKIAISSSIPLERNSRRSKRVANLITAVLASLKRVLVRLRRVELARFYEDTHTKKTWRSKYLEHRALSKVYQMNAEGMWRLNMRSAWDSSMNTGDHELFLLHTFLYLFALYCSLCIRFNTGSREILKCSFLWQYSWMKFKMSYFGNWMLLQMHHSVF